MQINEIIFNGLTFWALVVSTKQWAGNYLLLRFEYTD